LDEALQQKPYALGTDLHDLYTRVVAQTHAVPRVTDRGDRDKKKKPRNS
jgi:hypothetical protein